MASYPLTKGHVVVVWKEWVKDLHSLTRSDYEYLMDVVDIARNVLMEKLDVEKVYLLYLDEVSHVHWHLVPRYDEKGFNVLTHTPTKTDDFSLAEDMSALFLKVKKEYERA